MTGPSRRLAEMATKMVREVRQSDSDPLFHDEIDEQEMRRAIGYTRQDMILVVAYLLGIHVQIVKFRRAMWVIGIALFAVLWVIASRL